MNRETFIAYYTCCDTPSYNYLGFEVFTSHGDGRYIFIWLSAVLHYVENISLILSRDNFGLLWRNGLYRTSPTVTNDLSYFFTQSSISMSRLFQQARDLKTYYNQDTHNKTEDNSLWAKNPQSRRKTTNRYDLCWGEICHHRFGKKKFLNFLFTDDKIYSFHRQFS